MFRIKQNINSLSSVSTGELFSELYQQNRRKEEISGFLFDQATPGFELGKKDLQSPALPLGHAAKMIQKSSRITKFLLHLKFFIFFCFGFDPFLRFILEYLKIHNAKKILSLFY